MTDEIWRAAGILFERALTPDVLPVRLLGVGATKLTSEAVVQGRLFDDDRPRQRAVDKAVDAIRKQFGGGAIRRGSRLDPPGE